MLFHISELLTEVDVELIRRSSINFRCACLSFFHFECFWCCMFFLFSHNKTTTIIPLVEKSAGGKRENHTDSFSYLHGVYKFVSCLLSKPLFVIVVRLQGKSMKLRRESKTNFEWMVDDMFGIRRHVFGRSKTDLGTLWDIRLTFSG